MSNPQTQNSATVASTGILRSIRRFKSAQAGVAAMEFALVVPIMIGLYFMINETANGLRASRKVTMVSRVLADLASQQATLDNTAMNDTFAAATPILLPFDITKASMRITSIRFDSTGTKGYVDWSEVRGSGVPVSAYPRCTPTEVRTMAPGLPTTPIAVPAGLKVANSSVIYAETFYKYRPVIGWAISGDIDMKQELYMRPRTTEFVTRVGAATTPNCV